ncbi:MAG TPA: diaminopimelate epimerase [Terriglobales bacterium]|jgi:diaminopimelate epimerase
MSLRASVKPFVKATACGNDFLIIDGIHAPRDLGDYCRRICDRNNGVGADGVEWLYMTNDADVYAKLINADGSEAEISGNGTRCVAAYLCSEQAREKVVIKTDAGLKTCTLISISDTQYEFEVAMGKPRVEPELYLKLSAQEVRGTPVSIGNPHYVIFVDEFVPGWQEFAREVGSRCEFPHGVNLELVRIRSKNEIESRFYERGVGETRSSGTGSCASAVAAIADKRAVSPVKVHAPGGTQSVRWEDQVYLRGPAQIVCRGEYYVAGL